MSRFRGSIDVPLTKRGIEQANVAARSILSTVDVVIHDWQRRTIDTAQAISDFHNAPMSQWDVSSQHLGWLEGREVNETTLDLMRYYISHPDVVPHPGYSNLEPESFGAWLARWFGVFDILCDGAAMYKEHWVIVTHNRNIQALLSRNGSWIDFDRYDEVGPAPCSIYNHNYYVTLVRHGETEFGT